MKAKPNPCYGCIYYFRYIDDPIERCGVTSTPVSTVLKYCLQAKWKVWGKSKGIATVDGKRKIPPLPPAL